MAVELCLFDGTGFLHHAIDVRSVPILHGQADFKQKFGKEDAKIKEVHQKVFDE